MTEKELRKLSRQELLEMLLEQSKKAEQLETELAQAKTSLKDRSIILEEAGSIAEASLRLNGVFEAAQQACQQYIDDVRAMYERQKAVCAKMESESQAKAKQTVAEAHKRRDDMESDAKTKADEILKQATEEAEALTSKAKEESQRYWEEVSTKLDAFYQQYAGLRELMTMSLPVQKQDADA